MSSEDSIEQIVSLITSEDANDQTRGLQRIRQISALDESHVVTLVPHVVNLVKSNNAYINRLSSTTLENLVREHPATVAEAIDELVDSLSFDDEVSVRLVGNLVDQLRDDSGYRPDVPVDTAHKLTQSDPRPTRKAGYFFLGKSNAPEAAELLVEGIEINVGEMELAARAAFDEYREWAVLSIHQGDTHEAAAAAQTLQRLVKIAPSYLKLDVDLLLQSFNEDPYDELRQLFVAILIHDHERSQTVRTALQEKVLDASLTDSTERVLAQAALKVLVEARSSVPYHDIINRCQELATADDPTLRRHTVEQLYTLQQYNEGDQGHLLKVLAGLYYDENELVRKQARETYDSVLVRPEKLLRSGLAPLSEVTGECKINVLTNVLRRFAYRVESDGDFQRICFSDALKQTLDDIVDRFEGKQNTPIVWPAHEPEVVVLLTLALAIENGDGEDSTIALFTPGTQTQWGLLGDVRGTYDRYGVKYASSNRFVPMSDMLPHARVSDGQVVPVSEGSFPCTVVLTKDLDDLEAISAIDAVVLHYAAHTESEYGDRAQQLISERAGTSFFPTYSLYTKHEGEGYPRYGPPDGLKDVETLPSTRAIDTAIADDATENGGISPNVEFGDDAEQLTTPRRVRVREIHGSEHGKLITNLERAYEASADLRQEQLFGPANKVFSLHLFFERLPVPGEVFDEWIRQRHGQGVPRRFIPDIIPRRIENLDKYGGSIDDHQAVERIFSAVNYLERVVNQLHDTNPLFDELVSLTRTASAKDERVAVYTPSKSISMVVQKALEEQVPGVTRDVVSVVTPDTIRQLDQHDKLVFTGPQRPQEAGYYVHPRVGEVVVLTHDASWATMVEHHAEEYVAKLNASIGEPGNEPFSVPTVESEIPQTERDEFDEAAVSFKSVQPGASMEGGRDERAIRRESSRVSDVERLREAFRTATNSEFTESQSHYENVERINYEILTKDGSRLEVTSNDRVFVERENDRGMYRWGSPQSLVEGDRIRMIDPDVEAALWKSHLQKMYSNDLSDLDAMAHLETWFDTVVDITEEIASRVDASPTAPLVLDRIGEKVRQAGSDRVPGTVENWFRSVVKARSLIDLARDPDLTIGPRDVSDIESVGEAFDRRELQANAKQIEAAMNAIRHINRQGGHNFREKLLKRVNGSEEANSQITTDTHEVVEVKRSDSDEELNRGTSEKQSSSSGDDGVKADIGKEAISATDGVDRESSGNEITETTDHIRDLLALEPTTNGELAKEWGFESGKEVYQYMSTELEDYYYRGPNKKIRASDEAEELVSNQGG